MKSGDGPNEVQYLDDRSKYQEQNMLLGLGMSSQGLSDFDNDTTEQLVEPRSNNQHESQNSGRKRPTGSSNPRGQFNPAAALPVALSRTDAQDSGIISN